VGSCSCGSRRSSVLFDFFCFDFGLISNDCSSAGNIDFKQENNLSLETVSDSGKAFFRHVSGKQLKQVLLNLRPSRSNSFNSANNKLSAET